MNYRDFRGTWRVEDLQDQMEFLRSRDSLSGDAMTWSPRWQDRTGDAAPMRSHP